MKPTLGNNCLIKQPAGLGDIIFCQKLASFLISNGYKIWWPIVDEYYHTVNDYMSRSGVVFCRESDDYPMKDFMSSDYTVPVRDDDSGDIYLPLQHADANYPNSSWLKSKYELLNLDYINWQDHFNFTRNRVRENELFYEVLNLRDDTEYAFVNLWYGSPPNSVKKQVDLSMPCDVVELTMIDGYTIFDWCRVIEKASEIYCVDTSLFYIIDLLDLKANRLEAYSKFVPPNYMHIDGLFSAPWRYN